MDKRNIESHYGQSQSKASLTGHYQQQIFYGIYQSIVLHIEEINDTKRKANETLKKLISEDSARVEEPASHHSEKIFQHTTV